MNIVFCFEGLPYAEEQFSHRFFKHGGTYFPFYILYLYFVFEFVFVFQFLEVLKFVFEFSEAIFSQVLQTRWHFFLLFPPDPANSSRQTFPPNFPIKNMICVSIKVCWRWIDLQLLQELSIPLISLSNTTYHSFGIACPVLYFTILYFCTLYFTILLFCILYFTILLFCTLYFTSQKYLANCIAWPGSIGIAVFCISLLISLVTTIYSKLHCWARQPAVFVCVCISAFCISLLISLLRTIYSQLHCWAS